MQVQVAGKNAEGGGERAGKRGSLLVRAKGREGGWQVEREGRQEGRQGPGWATGCWQNVNQGKKNKRNLQVRGGRKGVAEVKGKKKNK